jgi:hypothetical protein
MKNQKLAAETFFTPNLAAAHILCRGRENQQKTVPRQSFAVHGCAPRQRNTARGREIHEICAKAEIFTI